MKMTTDAIDREMTGWIEEMPTVEPKALRDHRYPYPQYYIPCNASAGGMWKWYTFMGGGPKWTTELQPTECLDDAVRCVEARWGPMSWMVKPSNCSPRMLARIEGYDHEYGHVYTDGNHALALCLAAMSADKGETVEVEG